ncbi:hypothetical protein ACFL0V_05320 [Nanoarchaeota archaeon]
MIDELFFKEGFQKKKVDYILFGFVVALIGMVTSFLIFGIKSSQAQLLMVTLLLLPAVVKLISKEEKIVRNQGFKHVFANHKGVFEVFIFLFIGVFLAFFFMQLILMAKGHDLRVAYEFQTGILDDNSFLSYGFFGDKADTASFGGLIFSLLWKLLGVMIVTFGLSFLYGAGGVFVLVAMATIFSTMVLYLLKATVFVKFSLVYLFFVLVLTVPVILTSVAGGVISKAFIHEKVRSKFFKEVMREGFIIFMVAMALTVVIALVWAILLFVV